MKLNLITQGYKYNHELKCDMLIDARALINPFYVASLAPLTGLDIEVKKYIKKDKITKPYLKSLQKYLAIYLATFKKDECSVLIMCTGGRHRSVFLAEEIKKYFDKWYEIEVSHRDINA